jgi:hypothetical protein
MAAQCVTSALLMCTRISYVIAYECVVEVLETPVCVFHMYVYLEKQEMCVL